MKIRFKQNWRHFKSKDTVTIDDKNAKEIIKKGVAVEVKSKKKPATK